MVATGYHLWCLAGQPPLLQRRKDQAVTQFSTHRKQRQKGGFRRALRSHDEMVDILGKAFQTLPAIGGSLIGASAIATVVGAYQMQGFLEAIGSMWAMDYVPYTTMLRTGALGISMTLSAFALCLTVTLQMPHRRVVRSSVFWPLLATVLTALIVRSLSPGWAADMTRVLDVVLLAGVSLLIAMVATLLIATRPRDLQSRRIVVPLAISLVLCVITLFPWQQGTLDAQRLLRGDPGGLHPLVCIPGDPLAWHMVRPLGTSVLVARIGGGKMIASRMVAADVIEVLGPLVKDTRCAALPPSH